MCGQLKEIDGKISSLNNEQVLLGRSCIISMQYTSFLYHVSIWKYTSIFRYT